MKVSEQKNDHILAPIGANYHVVRKAGTWYENVPKRFASKKNLFNGFGFGKIRKFFWLWHYPPQQKFDLSWLD